MKARILPIFFVRSSEGVLMMTMRSFVGVVTKHGMLGLAALALLLGGAGQPSAQAQVHRFIFSVDDNTEGSVTAMTVDETGFVYFNQTFPGESFTINSNLVSPPTMTTTFAANILEPPTGALSDTYLVTAPDGTAGSTAITISFASDPDVAGATLTPLPNPTATLTEDGTFQSIGTMTLANQSTVTFTFRSEVEAAAPAVPEPASVALCGIGMVGLIGYAWRRRKPAA